MKITKYGHCALLIEDKGVRILTDPGSYSTLPEKLDGVGIVLITHEHGDHLHVGSLKKVLVDNPKAVVVSNDSVGKILKTEGISYRRVADGESSNELGILIEGMGHTPAEIYKSWGQVENTGYFVNDFLFYPGDAFYEPKRRVPLLALPVAGPWMKIGEAIRYALTVKPAKTFPVHDGIYKDPRLVYRVSEKVLAEEGIQFIPIEVGKETVFE